MRKLKTVAMLGRDVGLKILHELLLVHPKLDLQQVFTHQYLPKQEGAGLRPEANDYLALCQKHHINFKFLDYPEALHPHYYLSQQQPFDLLLVLSWRYIIPNEMLSKFTLACINIHRGALPKYKGAEPVKQAILANENTVVITAHHITAEIDEGPTICSTSIAIEPCPGDMTPTNYAETIKLKIKPFYVPLSYLALEIVTTT